MLGQMKAHNKQAYALFNKKFSSFALYDGKGGEDFLPYQVSSRFFVRDQDKRIIATVRKWLLNFQFKEGMLQNTSSMNNNFNFISIKTYEYV